MELTENGPKFIYDKTRNEGCVINCATNKKGYWPAAAVIIIASQIFEIYGKKYPAFAPPAETKLLDLFQKSRVVSNLRTSDLPILRKYELGNTRVCLNDEFGMRVNTSQRRTKNPDLDCWLQISGLYYETLWRSLDPHGGHVPFAFLKELAYWNDPENYRKKRKVITIWDFLASVPKPQTKLSKQPVCA